MRDRHPRHHGTDSDFQICSIFISWDTVSLLQCCQEQIKQTPFYVKIDCFWARDLISCVKGYFWPTWRWVNSFFDFCPFPQTFLTFFESPKKPKLPFFELGTWFFVWREVFDQHEHGSNHFLISALLRSKMALWSWAVQYIKWGLLDLFLAALYIQCLQVLLQQSPFYVLKVPTTQCYFTT